MDNLLVGIGEEKVLDENNPIAYTRDIHSCIVALIHREKTTTMMHIESYKYIIDIDKFLNSLKRNDNNKLIRVDIFKGENTEMGSLSIIKFILHRIHVKYNVYDVFKNLSNETSVGYNFNTGQYYIIRMNKGKPILKVKSIK